MRKNVRSLDGRLMSRRVPGTLRTVKLDYREIARRPLHLRLPEPTTLQPTQVSPSPISARRGVSSPSEKNFRTSVYIYMYRSIIHYLPLSPTSLSVRELLQGVQVFFPPKKKRKRKSASSAQCIGPAWLGFCGNRSARSILNEPPEVGTGESAPTQFYLER